MDSIPLAIHSQDLGFRSFSLTDRVYTEPAHRADRHLRCDGLPKGPQSGSHAEAAPDAQRQPAAQLHRRHALAGDVNHVFQAALVQSIRQPARGGRQTHRAKQHLQ